MRDFNAWFKAFRPSIADYKYYVDFKKVFSNVDAIRIPLNILNSLIGSKLNETARSYKTITLETKDLGYFKFVWFTDGCGWNSAKNNLKETFDVLENLYSIADLEAGIISKALI